MVRETDHDPSEMTANIEVLGTGYSLARLIVIMMKRPVGDALRRCPKRKRARAKKKRHRDARAVVQRAAVPADILADMVRFMCRRVGEPITKVRTSFLRSFMPRVHREMRDQTEVWYNQMTTHRFYLDEEDNLQDHRNKAA